MNGEVSKSFLFYTIILFGAVFSSINGDLVEDKQALLDFLQHVPHPHTLNWNISSSVCTVWTGVTCNNDHSRIIDLRLPGIGITGQLPMNTIGRLSALQVLSFRSNGISGSFPSDFSRLKNLTALYLQSNRFSGSLPTDFSVWNNLSILDLSDNDFNGSIPSSVSFLHNLTYLNLANNSFSGEIPDFGIPTLQQLNLSNNNFTGTLPKSLHKFPASAFTGNRLSPENDLSPTQPPTSRKTGKLSEPALLGIIIGSCVLLFVVIAVSMMICYSKKERNGGVLVAPAKSRKKEKRKDSISEKSRNDMSNNNNRLSFFEGCTLVFDLEDLLQASAEILGKGTFGTTYKAALEVDATTVVVVKRLKEVNSSKRDFEEQMEMVGNIRHENVAALRAYYYSKDEKLMVYDYYRHGSVSALLHGERGSGRTPLNWDTRLKIAIGAARGIAHIHTQNNSKLVHGNIKSTNIFLNSQNYGCVSDTGLATLIPTTHSHVTPRRRTTTTASAATTGYRAPETTTTTDTRKATTAASDVYSFGVLLLELLTGKSPLLLGSEEVVVVHLVRWVNSVVREEWTAEVFDVELLKYGGNIEDELVEMLQIGLACSMTEPEQRPKMVDVVRMVEEIRRNEYSSPREIKSEVSSSIPTPNVTEIGS